MHNNVTYVKTSLCANVQLNSTNYDFNLKSSLTPFFPPSPSIISLSGLKSIASIVGELLKLMTKFWLVRD